MRRDMFERLLGLPDADFKTGDTGRLLNRFTIDAGNVTGYATDVISVLVRETLVVIALICVLLYMSWVLTPDHPDHAAGVGAGRPRSSSACAASTATRST